MIVYDSMGQPYDADLVSGDDFRKLGRQNAKLRKDRERLDWLSDYASSHRYPWGVAWGFPAPSHSEDLREAIDAARKEGGAS